PYAKSVGGMNLCFAVEGGQNLSDLGLSGWFVLEDSGSSFTDFVAFGGPTIFSRQVDSPNFAQLRASLLDAWNQPRLKDIIFVKAEKGRAEKGQKKAREAPTHPSEAMMIIQRLKLTGAAILVFRDSTSL